MPKSARSIRLDQAQHRFINDWRADFNEEVREFLDHERVKEAAGICAVCARPVYISSHTVVSGGSPYGTALGLDSGQEIDLCTDCDEDHKDVVTDDDATPPSFDFLNDEYLLYRAERDAVADAQPEAEWSPLVTRREQLTESDRLLFAVLWARETNLASKYTHDAIKMEAILSALHEAAPDEDMFAL